jgi:signal transduction histidine kinase
VGSPSPEDRSSASAIALGKLQAVTDAALAHLPSEELLDELLVRIRDALEADTCAVLLLDETEMELVARAAKGLEEEVERGVRIPIGKGFAGRIAAERKPVMIKDLDKAEVVNPILREKGIKSMLGAPLIVEGRVLGVVHVGTLRPRVFTQQDVDLLQTVADRTALAIDRSLAHDEVVRMTETQQEFVALAAHELRTPATAIYGLAATLKERGSDLSSEALEEVRDTLFAQADRMRRLVEQLLDLSRLEAKRIKIRRERIGLQSHLVEIVESVAAGRAGDVNVDVPPDLEADLDPDAVDRVVGNLVTNALRYGAPPVTVAAEQTDRHVRIRVEDSGAGVETEFVPFLFDRFRRSRESRGKVRGIGLGLAIARSYARAHGGDLLYAPRRPQGSSFELVLPVDANGDLCPPSESRSDGSHARR